MLRTQKHGTAPMLRTGKDVDMRPHRCTTHSRMSAAASRADRRVDTRSKMQMPMAWLVMEGLAIHVADPSAMSLTCTCHAGSLPSLELSFLASVIC